MKMKLLKRINARKKEKNKTEKKNKMIIFRKKQVVAATLVVLIGVAGYLNWSFETGVSDESIAVMYNEAAKKLGEAQMVNNDEEESLEEVTETAAENYFAKAKIDREIKRDEAVEMLTSVLNSVESTDSAKLSAEEEIFTIADYTQKEVNAENLIKARGFSDAVVFLTADGASVAVESAGLSEGEAAVITETVATSADVDVSCIKIVEIKP